MAKSVFKTKVKNEIDKIWNEEWVECKYTKWRMSRTKRFFPKLSIKLKSKMMQISRNKAGRVIEFVTSHSNMREHANRGREFDPNNPPDLTCRICREPGSIETPWHVFSICPALAELRARVFMSRVPNVEEWTAEGLLEFVEDERVWRLLDSPEVLTDLEINLDDPDAIDNS